MAAYLRVTPAYPGQAVLFDDIIAYLTQNEVTYGVCEDAIRTFCQNGKFYSVLICAKGNPPVDGTDGFIEYKFDHDTGLKPKEREDGTVDFRDLGLVKNISKGEVLCQITPPGPGKDGMNIYNHIVPFVEGRRPTLPSGTNTVVSEDGLSLIANVDGCIESTKSSVNVSDVFIVHGDVDSASGNINAVGSVIVQGDVREGFFVKAGKDIAIRGMAEGATVEAKGTISISNGMNGMGKGVLRAGGNIVGKYFENAIIFSENDIYADVLMNCRVEVGGSIVLKGQKALMIGGSYQAAQKIYAKTIGSSSRTATAVSISSKELTSMLAADKAEESAVELENKLLKAQMALKDFQEQFATLSKQVSFNGQNDAQKESLLMKAAIVKKSQLTEAVEVIKAKLKKASEVKNNLTDYKIVGTNIVYAGTKMTIGPHTVNMDNDNSNTKFYATSEKIVLAPVLPSDVI
ncbi:MAG: hypothetical protein K0Q85_367 [Caproiciproducens sp.]|nr:hypothetical protein [Caproiciproducens sp.]